VRFSQKRQNRSVPSFFFQDLEENACSLQGALKSIAPGL